MLFRSRHIHPDWIQRDQATAKMYENMYHLEGNGIDQTFIKNLPFEQFDASNYKKRKNLGFPRCHIDKDYQPKL